MESLQEWGQLDVVIVSYECKQLLHDCLTSLQASPPARAMEVFVVDNGSSDGTVEMLSSEFPALRRVALHENAGFATATNLAIRRGSGEYVLALNPDTRMTRGTLDRLCALMDERPEIGICGCRLELNDGTFDHAARRSFPTIGGALGHFTGLGRRRTAPAALAQYRAPEVASGPVDAVNGAFMLMRRTALENVGLLDEGYWMYMEDLDLCYRFAEAGWLTWYEPGVTVVHVKAGSSGRNRTPRLNFAFHYGMYRFYRKFYAPKRRRAVNAAVYVGISTKLLVSVIRTGMRSILEERVGARR